MNRYLIFRTDRIGDFLISLILIKSIKNQDNNSHITIVASEQNFEFIKSFNIIDDVIIGRCLVSTRAAGPTIPIQINASVAQTRKSIANNSSSRISNNVQFKSQSLYRDFYRICE